MKLFSHKHLYLSEPLKCYQPGLLGAKLGLIEISLIGMDNK